MLEFLSGFVCGFFIAITLLTLLLKEDEKDTNMPELQKGRSATSRRGGSMHRMWIDRP